MRPSLYFVFLLCKHCKYCDTVTVCSIFYVSFVKVDARRWLSLRRARTLTLVYFQNRRAWTFCSFVSRVLQGPVKTRTNDERCEFLTLVVRLSFIARTGLTGTITISNTIKQDRLLCTIKYSHPCSFRSIRGLLLTFYSCTITISNTMQQDPLLCTTTKQGFA